MVDRLAPRALLAELDEDVEVIEAGKAPHAHTLTQAQIEDVLVERAARGAACRPSQGGRPLRARPRRRGGAGLRRSWRPGRGRPGRDVGRRGPGARGHPRHAPRARPRLHRGLRRTTPTSPGTRLRRVDGTLVLLMGVGRLAEAAAGLVDAGLAADTPVAVIENGSTPQQRTTVATLASIAEEAERRAVRSPAVVVIGDVVRLADALGPRTGHPGPRCTRQPGRRGTPPQLVPSWRRYATAVGLPSWVGWVTPPRRSPTRCDHAGEHAVVVPFLLAPAFHAREDVPAGASRRAGGRRPGPGRRRRRPTGPRPGVPARGDRRRLRCRRARRRSAPATRLTQRPSPGWRWPSAGGSVSPSWRPTRPPAPTLGEAVAALGKPVQRVAVASLFLAPGVLHDRVVAEAGDLGLAAVSAPLGAHPDLVELLVARADAAR